MWPPIFTRKNFEDAWPLTIIGIIIALPGIILFGAFALWVNLIYTNLMTVDFNNFGYFAVNVKF